MKIAKTVTLPFSFFFAILLIDQESRDFVNKISRYRKGYTIYPDRSVESLHRSAKPVRSSLCCLTHKGCRGLVTRAKSVPSTVNRNGVFEFFYDFFLNVSIFIS